MNRQRRFFFLLAAVAALLVFVVATACGSGDGTGGDTTVDAREDTLQTILDRGILICGVKADTPGFGVLNPDGSAVGNDVDYCHALAAAVLGDASKVSFKEAT